MIEFQDVSKTYGATQALKNLNLSIQEGQIVGLIGHNGACLLYTSPSPRD